MPFLSTKRVCADFGEEPLLMQMTPDFHKLFNALLVIGRGEEQYKLLRHGQPMRKMFFSKRRKICYLARRARTCGSRQKNKFCCKQNA